MATTLDYTLPVTVQQLRPDGSSFTAEGYIKTEAFQQVRVFFDSCQGRSEED